MDEDSHTFLLNIPNWPMEKTDGFWIMTMDYHKLNQVVTPIVATVPDVISLLEQLAYPLVHGISYLYKNNAFVFYFCGKFSSLLLAGKANSATSLSSLRGIQISGSVL